MKLFTKMTNNSTLFNICGMNIYIHIKRRITNFISMTHLLIRIKEKTGTTNCTHFTLPLSEIIEQNVDRIQSNIKYFAVFARISA